MTLFRKKVIHWVYLDDWTISSRHSYFICRCLSLHIKSKKIQCNSYIPTSELRSRLLTTILETICIRYTLFCSVTIFIPFCHTILVHLMKDKKEERERKKNVTNCWSYFLSISRYKFCINEKNQCYFVCLLIVEYRSLCAVIYQNGIENIYSLYY